MNIYWFLFITLLILTIQGWIYRRWGWSQIHYSRKYSTATCFRGDEVQILETISNRKLLPMPWLLLQSQFHTELQFQLQTNLDISKGQFYQNHKSIFSLMPYTQIIRKHRIICLKRGCYKLNTISLTSGDPFGVSKIHKTMQLDGELLVFPKPIPMEQVPLPSRSWQGEVIVRRWILDDPYVVAGAREYRYSDTLSGINWKATARNGVLQVHNRERTADHRVIIMVNFDLNESVQTQITDPETIEKALSYAITIADWVIGQGMEVGFACNGYSVDAPKEPVFIVPSGGYEALNNLYYALAKLVVAQSLGFEQFMGNCIEQRIVDTDIVLITAYVSAEINMHIEHLKTTGNIVTIIDLNPDVVTGEES
jgi:uncharacterized protein (DUF58 family)